MWTDHVSDQGRQSTDPLVATPLRRRDIRQPVVAPLEPVSIAPDPLVIDPGPVPAEDVPDIHVRSDWRIPLFGSRKRVEELSEENAQLKAANAQISALIDKHGLKSLQDLEDARAEAQREIDLADAEFRREMDNAKALARQEEIDAQSRLAATRFEQTQSEAQRDAARDEIAELNSVIGVYETGLYDYENPADNSVTLGAELAQLRAGIKTSVKLGDATKATTGFVFNGSKVQGQKFVNDMSKMMLRSYNAEAENAVKSVKAGNLWAAQMRLTKAVEQIERLGTMISLRITPMYHAARLKELELVNRHLQAVQNEREQERARREELREQRKAEQELAREKERLAKERSHYANAIEALRLKGDNEGAERMESKLADVDRAIEDVDYRAANIRAGYVYVISNIGAFGPDVVKIGLTRRLDPMDRVNELGDASVPFRFDVHALFFSTDAVSVEGMLHSHFEASRLNKINRRREYFNATPAQVLDALREHDVEVLEYTVEPLAEEFRASVLAVTS